MRIVIIVVSVLVSFAAVGQKVLRYEGAFPNDKHELATANYSYYKDSKTAKQIKHGSFRYNVKIKNTGARLYRNITGEYKDGWKQGLWNYSYTTKDYNTNNDGFYYSYNVELKANYENGWPDGEWYYTAFVKRRKAIRSSGATKWEAYEIVQNVRIMLNYENGVLVDSLWIRNDQGMDVFALMDYQGFLQGDFSIIQGNENMTIPFVDGFSIDKEPTAKTSLRYDYYKKHKSNLAKAGAKLDTVSLFNNKSCIVSKTLNKNVFNNSFFNYLYIDGDRLIKFTGSRKALKVDYRGLYKRELQVLISKDEQALIQSVYSFYNKAKRQSSSCSQQYKKSKQDVELRKKVNQLKGIEAKLKAYTCQLKAYKERVAPKEIALSTSSCGSDIKINEANTRIQILNTIYNRAKRLNESVNRIKCK